ncbi:uncharacterized protein JCM6883_002067 [Sporobolomyces salmoneus]|uniref:uncharacterized protein n=1 Tax=Sporobolomyces salmoneus TaxID=183962 RepID=UPI0031758356
MNTLDEVGIAEFIDDLASSLRTYSRQLSLTFPPVDVVRAPQLHSFAEVVKSESLDHFDIFKIWTPDLWSLLLFFIICISIKLSYQFLLDKTAIKRTQDVLSEKWSHQVEIDVARSVLKKPLSYTLAWILTITIETTCLILQCCAWRLWKLDDEPLRPRDLQFILSIIKLLLIGYCVDLLMAEKSYDIYLHHCFSFILLFVGQCTLYSTEDTIFPRLANWMILQATLALPLYFGLGLVSLEKFLHVQDYKIGLQKRVLKYAYYFMRFMTWIYIPQKVVPAAFCLYWLGKMWNDVKHSAWGIAWLTIATLTIPLLLLLQIFVLSDSVAARTNFIGYRVFGGPLPSRRGPIARFVSRLLSFNRVTSNEKGSDRQGADERAANASAKSKTPLFSIKLKEEAGRKGSVASSMTAA